MAVNLQVLRTAIADYMRAEGCSCCRNAEDWERAKADIAEMLDVPRYADDSGWDFSQFCSKRREQNK